MELDNADEIFKIHSNTLGSCPIGSNVRGLLVPHLNSAVAAMKAELSKVTLGQLIDELYRKILPSKSRGLRGKLYGIQY
ncbi:hypothetical protein [Desulfosporosinus orientis]|uniref:hypothetical protein n=1 Tax=Desulfosporosinus orientis TaxID=1563 RepID=UPI0002DA7508|nr:hypothetical protein [Desulfosporosinus orientis]